MEDDETLGELNRENIMSPKEQQAMRIAEKQSEIEKNRMVY
jgi:hypothetical protein